MSRSSGIYPSYVKLDLDPQAPPDGWNEGIRRCMQCKQAWPNLGVFSPSPCCNVHAGISVGENLLPDMTWAAAVKALFVFRFEKYYEKWNEGLTDEQLVWLDEVTPYEEVRTESNVNTLTRVVQLDKC